MRVALHRERECTAHTHGAFFASRAIQPPQHNFCGILSTQTSGAERSNPQNFFR